MSQHLYDPFVRAPSTLGHVYANVRGAPIKALLSVPPSCQAASGCKPLARCMCGQGAGTPNPQDYVGLTHNNLQIAWALAGLYALASKWYARFGIIKDTTKYDHNDNHCAACFTLLQPCDPCDASPASQMAFTTLCMSLRVGEPYMHMCPKPLRPCLHVHRCYACVFWHGIHRWWRTPRSDSLKPWSGSRRPLKHIAVLFGVVCADRSYYGWMCC